MQVEVGSSTYILGTSYLIQYLIEDQLGFLLLYLLIIVMVGISNCPYFTKADMKAMVLNKSSDLKENRAPLQLLDIPISEPEETYATFDERFPRV